MKEVGITVVSFNDPAGLANCARSILNKLHGTEFHVAIVDNGSSDTVMKGLLGRLDQHDRISVIRKEHNTGYAVAVNTGVAFLREEFGECGYFMILNQDTVLLNDVHTTLVRTMREESSAGILGPALFNRDGTQQNSSYAFHTPFVKAARVLGLRNMRPFVHRLPGLAKALNLTPGGTRQGLSTLRDHDKPFEVPWIKGACLAVRPQVFRDVGLFDESFTMYAEDMDFCKRARDHGCGIYSVPEAQVLHTGGHLPSHRSIDLVNTYYESMALYYTKHFKGPTRRLMLLLNNIEYRYEQKACRRRAAGQ
jgi:GT2 family glycosyltransferase